MPKNRPHHILETSALSKNDTTGFEIKVDSKSNQELIELLGLIDVQKLRFSGHVTPLKNGDFHLKSQLGVTITQTCCVTLEPVKTRLDISAERRFCKNASFEVRDKEIEMPDDDSVEPLGETIDLLAIVQEEIALNMPSFPRKQDVDFIDITGGPIGGPSEPEVLRKPFADLEQYKEKLFGPKS